MPRTRDDWFARVARLATWASLAYDRESVSAERFAQAYGVGNSILAEPIWLERGNASAYLLLDKANGLVLAVTGSNSLDDWSVNLRLGLTSVGDLRVSATAWEQALILAREFVSVAMIPAGGNLRMADRWLIAMNNNPNVTFIGHSLGGAISILMPIAIRYTLGKVRSGNLRIGKESKEELAAVIESQRALWKAIARNAEVITYGAWRPLTTDTAAYYPYRSTHVEMVGDIGVVWPPAWMGRWHPGRLIVVDPMKHRLYAKHSGFVTLIKQIWAILSRRGFEAHASTTYVNGMSNWLDASNDMSESFGDGIAAAEKRLEI